MPAMRKGVNGAPPKKCSSLCEAWIAPDAGFNRVTPTTSKINRPQRRPDQSDNHHEAYGASGKKIVPFTTEE